MTSNLFSIVNSSPAWIRTDSARAAILLGGRRDQQDAFVWNDALWAVADGMGGHRDGALAARTALEALATRITGPVDEDAIRDAFRDADQLVRDLGEPGEMRPPGATLVALVRRGDDSLTVASTGDSRAYLIRAGVLEQITEDHEDDAGGLTAYLGGPAGCAFRVDLFDVPAHENHRILLASDGLFGHIPRGGIETLAAVGFKHLLVEAARTSRDNVTAVLVDTVRFAAGT